MITSHDEIAELVGKQKNSNPLPSAASRVVLAWLTAAAQIGSDGPQRGEIDDRNADIAAPNAVSLNYPLSSERRDTQYRLGSHGKK